MNDKKIMFYHATETTTLAVLFELLKKSFLSNKRCLVCIDTIENSMLISDSLWQFQDNFILPHANITDVMPEHQPILLTHNHRNINQADYVFFIGQVDINDKEEFERYIIIFDNNSETIKSNMRDYYKSFKNAGKTVIYHKQQQGSWVIK